MDATTRKAALLQRLPDLIRRRDLRSLGRTIDALRMAGATYNDLAAEAARHGCDAAAWEDLCQEIDDAEANG